MPLTFIKDEHLKNIQKQVCCWNLKTGLFQTRSSKKRRKCCYSQRKSELYLIKKREKTLRKCPTNFWDNEIKKAPNWIFRQRCIQGPAQRVRQLNSQSRLLTCQSISKVIVSYLMGRQQNMNKWIGLNWGGHSAVVAAAASQQQGCRFHSRPEAPAGSFQVLQSLLGSIEFSSTYWVLSGFSIFRWVLSHSPKTFSKV